MVTSQSIPLIKTTEIESHYYFISLIIDITVIDREKIEFKDR